MTGDEQNDHATRNFRTSEFWAVDGQAGSNPKVRFADHSPRIVRRHTLPLTDLSQKKRSPPSIIDIPPPFRHSTISSRPSA